MAVARPERTRHRRQADCAAPALPAFTAEQVRELAKRTGRALVVLDGGVHDVSSVLAGHPGGPELLQRHVGGDVSRVFRGQGEPGHAHSAAAHRSLSALLVGRLCESAHTSGAACEPPAPGELDGGAALERACGVDSRRGMVFQVGKLGAQYPEWLGYPSLSSEPLRMFDGALLEASSKTPWWTVPLLWLPLAAAALWEALVRHATPPAVAVVAAAAGLLAWGCVEYALHRFVFHAHPAGYWGITLHFSFHGCHHKHPLDRLRLVFPPLFAAPLVAFFRAAIRAALPGRPGAAAALFGGMLAGYVAYDCMHYWAHHAGARSRRWLAAARAAHLAHHYDDPTRSFGVSGDLFDRVFGTLPRRPRAE